MASGAKFGSSKFGIPKLASASFKIPIITPSLHLIDNCDAFYWIDGELQAAWYKHAMYEMYLSMNGDQRDVFVEEINRHELGILAQERLCYVEAEFENYKARMMLQLKREQSKYAVWRRISIFIDVFVGFDVGIVVHCHLGYDGSIKGSNNDVNVLRQSPVLNDLKVGKALEVPFVANDQAHEAARKDVERAFGMLKKKWAIVRTPARSRSLKRITHLMYTCIILHNMIRKEKGKAISPDFYPEEQHREDDPVRSAQDRLRVIREIHDEETHLNLKADL
ncbi:putative nuclease HARBI1 isoform X2 [Tanacetum coccineum]